MSKRLCIYVSLLLALILAPVTSQARWLNLDDGRFQTMDAYQGNLPEPLSLHKYDYAHDDPVNNTDPSGHVVVEVLITLTIVTLLAVTVAGCSSDPIPASAMIVHADPGGSGQTFEMAAHTHRRELQRGGIWAAPVKPKMQIEIAKATTVSQFVGNLKGKKIAYLAYYGHSSYNALHFGMSATPDTNLADPDSGWGNASAVNTIPEKSFSKDAIIRLFGCYAGIGPDPIAQRIASHTKKPVWAYSNEGGSLFTDDPVLGYGRRSVTQADVNKFEPSRGGRYLQPDNNKDLWLVPLVPGGVPAWKKFTP